MLYLRVFLPAIFLLAFGQSTQVRASYFRGLSSGSCPTQEFIQPCTCKMTAFGMHVICLRVPTADDLRRIFNVLKDYELAMLLLQETRLIMTTETGSLFGSLKVQILRLVECVLPGSVIQALRSHNRNAYLLDGLGPILTRIDIVHCKLGNNALATMGLAKLGRLNEVNINRESMNVVKKSWFSTSGNARNGRSLQANIKVLRLEENQIAVVEANAFENLGSLVILSLAKNSINTINRNILPATAAELQTLDMSTNSLSSLPTNFFSSMPNLRKVLLYHNNFRSISQSTFAPVWEQLETFWVNANPIVCDQGLVWVTDMQNGPHALVGECVAPTSLEGVQISGLSKSLLEPLEPIENPLPLELA